MKPEATVLPIHFEDRPGSEFERLCYAYLWHAFEWASLEWYGQLGGDSGRDIWGIRKDGETVCYQCANWKSVKFKKVQEDIEKLIHGKNGIPHRYTLIVGGKVTSKTRDKTKTLATSKEIKATEIWSGAELEERLRKGHEVLLHRFVDGVAFPEDIAELRDPRIDMSQRTLFLLLEKELLPQLDKNTFGILRSDWAGLGQSLPDFIAWLKNRGQVVVMAHGVEFHVRLKNFADDLMDRGED